LCGQHPFFFFFFFCERRREKVQVS
jgi:hypothetical protein